MILNKKLFGNVSKNIKPIIPKKYYKYIPALIAIILFFSSFFVYFNNSQTPNLSQDVYLVVKVTDGDTITVKDSNNNESTIRYLYVDTPESVKPNTPVQCYAKEASDYNKNLLLNKKVKLEMDVEDKDVYGRLLRYVYVDKNNDGTYSDMVNNDLLQNGFAHIYKSSSGIKQKNIKYQNLFETTEKNAKDNDIGLWKECVDRDGNYDPYPKNLNTDMNLSPTPTITNVNVTNNSSLGLTSETSECKIKGNINSSGTKIYHMQGQKYYNQTKVEPEKGERWFCTEADAQNQGYRKSSI